jgi:SAM-dependent methyltransferase
MSVTNDVESVLSDLESPACDMCGSRRRRTLYSCGDWRFGVPEPQYSVCECKGCGLAYLAPRPASISIGKHYPSDYDKGRDEQQPETAQRYQTQLEFIGRGDGRLLDIGTARGDFIKLALEQGWDAYGIEPHARTRDPNPRIQYTSLENFQPLPGGYDLITAWHVLEHVHSPSRVFDRVVELLKPGGRFCVSVPNFDSYWARWLKAEDLPRHLYFFTLKTLQRMGQRKNLGVTRHSFNVNFSSGGALGRGSFDRWVYGLLAGLSVYDYLKLISDPERSLREEHPWLYQICRPVQWWERRLLTPSRLKQSGKMGVVAVEFVRASNSQFEKS